MLVLTNMAYAKSACAAVYEIEAPFAPWLWPLLAVLGICCELAAAIRGKTSLLFIGLALASTGCIGDSDLALLTGNALACTGLFVCIRR